MNHTLFSEIKWDQLYHLFSHMIKNWWEPRIDYSSDTGWSISAYRKNWFKWWEETETKFDLSKPLNEQEPEVLDNILLIFK